MKLLAAPYLALVWRTPALRRAALACVALSLVASAAEIGVALALVPILASLGMDAGGALAGFVGRIPPAGWLALFALAAALRSLAGWQSAVQSEHATQALVVSLQSRLYRALAGAHWDTVRRLAPPSITSALQTQAYDAGYGFSSMVQVVAATLLVLGYAVSAALVFPLMLPVLALLVAFMWRLNARRSARVQALSEDYCAAQTGLHQRYEDWVAISRIASLGVDAGRLADRFETEAREAAAHAVGFSRSAAATRVSYEAAVVLGVLAGVPLAWWLETPPALLVFGLVLFVRVLPRAGAIHVGYQGLINAVAPVQAVERLATRLEADAAGRPAAAVAGAGSAVAGAASAPAGQAPLAWDALELAGVGVEDTLREGGRRWILRDVELALKHGEWLALTGPTGAGKTTLAEVMLALVRPDAGELHLDGRAMDEALAGRWRRQAAYVPQDVVLFDATLRDNLRLHAPEASDAELEAALHRAAADFVMTRLPEGLDTRAGPGGRWLSGGERQRIGIARALLRKPGLLVLDEPTAALDADTQGRLMDALAGLEHSMSVVLITHRPELLRLADRVIGVADGRADALASEPLTR